MGICLQGSVVIFIVAPGDFATGGPEALHQLCDALNRNGQRRASMLYRPFRSGYQVPKPFCRYNISVAEASSVTSDSIVVLPETSGDMIDVFPASARIHFWWLSVDNFFTMAGEDTDAQVSAIARRVSKHLYQSEYAREFLERASLGPVDHLSDYLADEYRRAAGHPVGSRRDDLLVYNPVKGAERTKMILDEMNESVQVVPIEGMTRNQIRQVLKCAKVYIDFGEHPGKDRIPREAAALGACVLTNRRGSAANTVDVPIPDEYKIDDEHSDFPVAAATKIREIMKDFKSNQQRFGSYRQSITTELAGFLSDVEANYATV
jgi:hypothetical protein